MIHKIEKSWADFLSAEKPKQKPFPGNKFCYLVGWSRFVMAIQKYRDLNTVEYMRADQVGGGGWRSLCFKISYSSREPRSDLRPCIKIGYSSAMY